MTSRKIRNDNTPLLKSEFHKDSEGARIYGATDFSSRFEFEGETDWRQLGVAYFLMATNVIQFSMYFASLWPYLKEIDGSSTPTFFGYTVAVYSVGQIIASPIFGWWSTRTKSTRSPILTGVAINIVANLIYWFAEMFPPPRRWALFCARLLTGISAGNLGVLRAYVAEASTTKDKISAISVGNMVITLGFIIGPGFQAVFAPIGYPGSRIGAMHLDMYTAPSLFATVLGFISAVVLLTCYQERFVGIRDKSEDPNSNIEIPPFDKIATGACLWLWFCTLCYFTVSESISAPFTMVMYNWTRAEATQYVGIIYAVSGGISCLVYLAALYFKNRINLRKAIIAGFSLMFLFYFVSFPWPGLPKSLHFQNVNESLHSNISRVVGCDPEFHWCKWMPQVNLVQYIVALICGAIGYPIATAYVSVLFTLVIGPRRQGTMQGIFTMSGSFARCFAPFFVSITFEHFGPRIPWIVTGALMLLSGLLVIVIYRRLVPLDLSSIDREKLTANYAESIISVE